MLLISILPGLYLSLHLNWLNLSWELLLFNMPNKCPNCDNDAVLSKTNKFRPFCSEKCKLIDFGAWATEKFKIPGNHNGSEYDENL